MDHFYDVYQLKPDLYYGLEWKLLIGMFEYLVQILSVLGHHVVGQEVFFLFVAHVHVLSRFTGAVLVEYEHAFTYY